MPSQPACSLYIIVQYPVLRRPGWINNRLLTKTPLNSTRATFHDILVGINLLRIDIDDFKSAIATQILELRPPFAAILGFSQFKQFKRQSPVYRPTIQNLITQFLEDRFSNHVIVELGIKQRRFERIIAIRCQQLSDLIEQAIDFISCHGFSPIVCWQISRSFYRCRPSTTH